MQSFDFKKLLPHIYVLLGFIAISLLFSYPQLEGQVLKQGDFVSWKAMSKEARDWHEQTGENVMWTNAVFGGMPTFTFYVGKMSNYIYPIQETIMNILGKPTGFLFLAMLGFYMLSLTLGIKKWLRIAGAVAYAFSTYNITLIEAGHETKMWALAYIPMVLSGLLLLYRGKWWTGVPVLGIPMALLMWTSHYQVMYYAIFIILGMVITLFVIAYKEGQLKRFFIASGIALLTAAVGIGPNMQIFLATLQYNKTTMRGGESELTINHDKNKKGGGLDKDYAFGWSNAWGESFTVLVPYLYGGASHEDLDESSQTYKTMTGIGVAPQQASMFVEYQVPTYWGPQPFTGGPFYFSAIICFLFILAILVVKSPHKWWILAVSLLAFLMATGRHFPSLNYFLFDTLPGFNKFRVPNMIMVIPQLLFPLFAVWGMNDLLFGEMDKKEIWKKVRIAGGVTVGICLVLAFAGSAFFDYSSHGDERLRSSLTQSFRDEGAANRVVSAIQEDRQTMATNSALTSVVFILLMGGLLWAYYKGKVQAQYVAMGLLLLVAIDLIRVDKNYLGEDKYVDPDSFEELLAPRRVDTRIMQDPDPYYRVLDLSVSTNNNAIQSAHHKCIGGYSPAKMEIYQDMIDIHMGVEYNQEVLNMLNTKYIISPQGQQGEPVAIPNPMACGNAWFVEEIQWEETADDAILALSAEKLGSRDTMDNAFRPLKTAVMRSKYQSEIGQSQFAKDSSAVVKLDKYGLNNISYYSKNSSDGFAVFSDIYYPYGWKAYVDGEETPIYNVNYLLRGLKLPAGEHKIEFKFHPKKFYIGDRIAMVASILLILAALGSIYMAIKGKDSKPAK